MDVPAAALRGGRDGESTKACSPTKPKAKRARRQPKRILNCEPSLETEDDWRIDTAEDAGVLAAAPRVPARKDLRQSWWRIRDQGSTGSCVGWAAADGVLRWHFVKAGRIATSELLSARFQWLAAKETDTFNTRPTTFVEAEGTSLKAALDVSRKFGAVKDAVLPFATGQLYGGNAQTFYAIAAQLKISMYFNLGREIENWRTWLATKGPILTRLNVDSTWGKAIGEQGQARALQAPDGQGRARRDARRLHAGDVHRPQQLGHGLGRPRLRARLARRTRRPPSRRRTGSKSERARGAAR